MKHLLMIALIAILNACSNTQNAQVPQMLNHYMDVKNALVSSNATLSKEKASALVSCIQNMPVSGLKSKEKTAFVNAQKKLLKAAQSIQNNADIEKQRLAFADLSLALWPVIKVSESVTKQVYYAYCPMKDAYWLSYEAVIRNPYYGSKMLDCGSVKEKKNP
jgi:hypothetical protein